MQWPQDPRQSDIDNLNNKHFRNKKKEYLKTKRDELQNNSKIKNIRDLFRGINDFKPVYQLRTHIIGDEKGDFVADSHSILTRWRNCFSQLLNVHGFNYVRQKYTQQSQQCLSRVPLSLRWLLKRKAKKTHITRY